MRIISCPIHHLADPAIFQQRIAESTGDFQGEHRSDVISLSLGAAASNSEFEIF